MAEISYIERTLSSYAKYMVKKCFSRRSDSRHASLHADHKFSRVKVRHCSISEIKGTKIFVQCSNRVLKQLKAVCDSVRSLEINARSTVDGIVLKSVCANGTCKSVERGTGSVPCKC